MTTATPAVPIWIDPRHIPEAFRPDPEGSTRAHMAREAFDAAGDALAFAELAADRVTRGLSVAMRGLCGMRRAWDDDPEAPSLRAVLAELFGGLGTARAASEELSAEVERLYRSTDDLPFAPVLLARPVDLAPRAAPVEVPAAPMPTRTRQEEPAELRDDPALETVARLGAFAFGLAELSAYALPQHRAHLDRLEGSTVATDRLAASLVSVLAGIVPDGPTLGEVLRSVAAEPERWAELRREARAVLDEERATARGVEG